MKVCIKCNTEKEIIHFVKNTNRCKSCRSIYMKEYSEKNKEKLKQSKKEYYIKNKTIISEKAKEYYTKNKEHVIKKSKKYAENNKKKVTSYKYKYRKNNKGIYNHYLAKRRSTKLKATPQWADLGKIKVLYEKAQELSEVLGVKMTVDHVIPLQGNNICGLHIWENLQLLEASENFKKSNKF